jgi:hypothetical protein
MSAETALAAADRMVRRVEHGGALRARLPRCAEASAWV